MAKDAIAVGLSLIEAHVMHARLRPKRNAFRYRVPYLALPAALMDAGGTVGLLSVEGRNLFSVKRRDYGDAERVGSAFVRNVLEQRQIAAADGEIVLVTMPRMFGFVFNPVSFWFCLDKGDGLRAVVAEVNNTFGERHFYVCRHDDQRRIAPQDTITAEKVFHVSPFMPVDGHYRFSFSWGERAFGCRIDLHDEQGLILTTSVSGVRVPFSSWRLARALALNPLLMFKVLGLIHYQAVRLWAKGVRHFSKPPPPREPVSS
jgi:uncharacterized protein